MTSQSPKNSTSLEYLSNLLDEEMVFIDLEADTGQYVFQANKAANRVSIYAIEPDPVKFETLKRNCLEWEDLSDNCIYSLHIAISDRDQNTQQESLIKTYKMDTLFDRVDPDLIKIGCGSELQVLKGSTKILKRGKAKFLLTAPEYSKNHFSNLRDFMNSFGYAQRDFYGQKLFVNPIKRLAHTSKRIYRQVLPVSFRQKVQPIFRIK